MRLGLRVCHALEESVHDLMPSLEQYLGAVAQRDSFSGVVLVADGDAVFPEPSHRQACRRFGVPNKLDTRFDVASLGKMFTGVAIGQLVERGVLTFDAPLATYLPAYPRDVGERVSLHHLLTHTSGLGSIFAGGWDVASRVRFRTVDDLLPYFRQRPLLFEPGTRWEYSNAGYVLLGAVIEAVMGRPFFDYVKNHIFVPAGMDNTAPHSLDEEVPRLAYAYTRLDPVGQVDTEPRWNNVYRHWTVSTPAECVYSIAQDLLRFAHAFFGGKLVSKSMLSMLTEAKVPTGQRVGQHYGYGFSQHPILWRERHLLGWRAGRES